MYVCMLAFINNSLNIDQYKDFLKTNLKFTYTAKNHNESHFLLT